MNSLTFTIQSLSSYSHAVYFRGCVSHRPYLTLTSITDFALISTFSPSSQEMFPNTILSFLFLWTSAILSMSNLLVFQDLRRLLEQTLRPSQSKIENKQSILSSNLYSPGRIAASSDITTANIGIIRVCRSFKLALCFLYL